MKLFYKPVIAGGAYVLFADDSAGDAIKAYPPKSSAAVLEENAYNAASPILLPLGNAKSQVDLEICKVYATAGLADAGKALLASVTIPALFINIQNHIQFQEVYGSGQILYLPYALCDMQQPTVEGGAVTFRMTFKGRFITTTAP
jgi:hypothetical protein